MTNRPFRAFDHAKDMAAVQRIWIETGWIDDEKDELKAVSDVFKVGHTEVATINDRAECSVLWTPGSLHYQGQTLPMGAVAAVTTSHVARKQGFARELTARSLAQQVKEGKIVSSLGMFDQGFYNKVGYGTGPYVNQIQFDPSTLTVDSRFRPPKRLTHKDYKQVHKAMANRKLYHGGVILHPPEIVRADMQFTEKPFGLGYFDGPNNSLSHFIWGEMKGEHGPYRLATRAYQTNEQLMELLALIKSLGDQVNSFILDEFGEFQFQDLLTLPFRNERKARDGKYPQRFQAHAFWQLRILDLAECIKATRTDTSLTFNLTLTDPVADILTAADGWQGVAGDYTVTLGDPNVDQSKATKGHTSSLPSLTASVNAFSRWWLGVRPASQLALTDELHADEALLAKLDATLHLPVPDFGWDF